MTLKLCKINSDLFFILCMSFFCSRISINNIRSLRRCWNTVCCLASSRTVTVADFDVEVHIGMMHIFPHIMITTVDEIAIYIVACFPDSYSILDFQLLSNFLFTRVLRSFHPRVKFSFVNFFVITNQPKKQKNRYEIIKQSQQILSKSFKVKICIILLQLTRPCTNRNIPNSEMTATFSSVVLLRRTYFANFNLSLLHDIDEYFE